MSIVEEQSTGDFSIMGGYSTAEGWLAQMSVSERNLLGTGRYGKAAVTYGEYRSRRRTSVLSNPISSISGSPRASICSPRDAVQQLPVLWHAIVRRQLQARHCAARRPCVATALFDLYAEDHAAVLSERLQQHQSGFRQHLSDANGHHRRGASMWLPVYTTPATHFELLSTVRPSLAAGPR